MKKIYSIVAFLFISIGFAQVPAGYYNTATGTGYALKTQLYNIIKTGHIDRGYGSGSSTVNNGLWTAYGTTDRDNFYDHDNSVLDIYSENPTGPDPYTYSYNSSQCGTYNGEGDCYNREHIVPQSVFSSANPMHNDPHFIPPTDGKVNGMRNNYPHGMVTSPTWTSLNGGKLGPNANTGISAGYTGVVFEPINEFKGDIARMYLYFATRYENLVSGYTYDMFNGTSNQVFTNTFLNILITWHNQDPVSPYEIARNNAIYAFQGNRNPYIDHPEYVCQIWTATCNALATEDFSFSDSFKIYPNPSNGKFNIDFDGSYDNYSVEIFSTVGQKVFEKEYSNSSNIEIANLQSGMYLVKVTKDSRSIVKKIVIN